MTQRSSKRPPGRGVRARPKPQDQPAQAATRPEDAPDDVQKVERVTDDESGEVKVRRTRVEPEVAEAAPALETPEQSVTDDEIAELARHVQRGQTDAHAPAWLPRAPGT